MQRRINQAPISTVFAVSIAGSQSPLYSGQFGRIGRPNLHRCMQLQLRTTAICYRADLLHAPLYAGVVFVRRSVCSKAIVACDALQLSKRWNRITRHALAQRRITTVPTRQRQFVAITASFLYCCLDYRPRCMQPSSGSRLRWSEIMVINSWKWNGGSGIPIRLHLPDNNGSGQNGLLYLIGLIYKLQCGVNMCQ